MLRLLDQTDAARTMIGLHGSPSFRSTTGGGGPGTGRPRRRPEQPGTADHCGSLDRSPESQGSISTQTQRKRLPSTTCFYPFMATVSWRRRSSGAFLMRDTVADAASSELADIRRHMQAAQAKSRQILQKIISSPTYGKILQETIITQQDGRFVVPVRGGAQGDLPGGWFTTSLPLAPRCSWNPWGWSRPTMST